MAHSLILTTLESASDEARDAGNPIRFLNRLESLHANWHARSFTRRGLGFLSFHWYVLEHFRRARCPNLWTGGVRPFRPTDFATFGWPYDVTARARASDIQSLADCSQAIEVWHNDAHMAVGMAFGIENDMMDPRVNIYYREFWRLHYFINRRFLRELRRYYATGSSRRKIEQLDSDHHDRLHEV